MSVDLSTHFQHSGLLYYQYSKNLNSSISFLANISIVCANHFKRTAMFFGIGKHIKKIMLHVVTLQFKKKLPKRLEIKENLHNSKAGDRRRNRKM